MRVRFDYRGVGKQGKIFSRAREGEEIAEEIREQKAILLRNIPVQGVQIEDINTNGEVYLVGDDETGREIAYAPVEFTIEADTIEDLIPFLLRDEFRKVDILSPEEMLLDKQQIERIIYKINEELRNYQLYLKKRYENS